MQSNINAQQINAQKHPTMERRFRAPLSSWMSYICISALLSTTVLPILVATAFAPLPHASRRVSENRVIQKERGQMIPLFIAKSGGRMIETAEEFGEIVLSVESPRPVLAFFSAAWCGPCRLSIPVIKDIMKQFSGQIDVVEICTDDLAETSADCGVVSIPTIQFYYKGNLLDTIVGCVARSVLASAVTKVLEDISVDDNRDVSQGNYRDGEQ